MIFEPEIFIHSFAQYCENICLCVKKKERKKERKRDRQTDRERERERERNMHDNCFLIYDFIL